MSAPAARPGVSALRLVLLAAVAGVVFGVTLFKVRDVAPEERFDAAEAAAAGAVPLGAASESADPMAPDPQSLRGLRPYPGAAPRKMLSNGAVQQVPMALSWFQTDDSPDAVLSFYERAFAEESREHVSHRFSEHLGYVGWLERLGGLDAGPAHGIMHMVSVSREGPRTMVLLSASRPDLLMEAEPKLPEGLTLPEATEAPQVIQMGEGADSREVIYARTLNQTPADVMRFFESQLRAAGWSITEHAAGAEQDSVVARRGSTSIVVNAQADGVDSSLVLTLSRQSRTSEVIQ